MSAIEIVTTMLTCDVCGATASLRGCSAATARARARESGWRRGTRGTDVCGACALARRLRLAASEAGRALARVEGRCGG